MQSYAVKELAGVLLPAGHRAKAFLDELEGVNVEEVLKNAAVRFNVGVVLGGSGVECQ